MASHTQGVGQFTVENILTGLKAIPETNGTCAKVPAEARVTWVPSTQECRFCDIRAADCRERVDEGSEPEGRTTGDF